MESEKHDFSKFGGPSDDVSQSILKGCFIVEIGMDARVPLVVPFGSLESVVKMALSSGMSVVIDVSNNPDFCVWKSSVKGVMSL